MESSLPDLDDLSRRERAAQLLFPRIGSNLPPGVTVAEDVERVEAQLAGCPAGGLILFNGELPGTPEALARLQRRSRVPLLISTDMERGVGQQLRGATVFPHAMAFSAAEARLGAEGAEALLEEAARAQAREALACGIHVTFAPDADVNRDPRNPIIATRAFGTEPDQAARYVRAYLRGTRAEGLLATAKHFPGHGNTHQDSHAELPSVDDSREELLRTDLVPFRAAIEEGVELVMSAHVVYPALDPARRPATLSRPILTDLLRRELGFEGAVVTDSLLMGAIRESHPDPGAQAVALVEAGVDMLLDLDDPEAALAGLLAAVEDGRLAAERIDEACGRVLALKRQLVDRFGMELFVDPAGCLPGVEVGAAAHRKLAGAVARAAIREIDVRPGVVPVDPGESDELLVVYMQPHRSRLDPPEAALGAAVRAAFPGVRYEEVRPEAGEDEFAHLERAAREAGQVVVAAVVKPAAWHAFGLLPAQQAFVERLVAARPVVLASLGSPLFLEKFPGAAARVCTYSDVPASQEALAAWLAGIPTPS